MFERAPAGGASGLSERLGHTPLAFTIDDREASMRRDVSPCNSAASCAPTRRVRADAGA